MSDFLTEKIKNRNTWETEMGSLWLFYTFSLGAIGASEKYIGEGRWGMAATEIILGLLFLYPTFREIQKALKKKKLEKLPAGLNPMPRIPSHLKSLSRNWEKVQ